MLTAERAVIDCSRCGHRWLESRAMSPAGAQGPAREAEPDPAAQATQGDEAPLEDAAAEAARAMAAAALAHEKARRARLRHRRREVRRFAALGLFLAAVGALLAAFPDVVVRHAPGAARLYALAGIRPAGLEFGSLMATRTRLTSGKTMLAVRGEIVNRSRLSRRAPALAFTLVDDKGRALHSWRLPASSPRPLASGRSARFVTRIAAPPEGAARVVVRLARES